MLILIWHYEDEVTFTVRENENGTLCKKLRLWIFVKLGTNQFDQAMWSLCKECIIHECVQVNTLYVRCTVRIFCVECTIHQWSPPWDYPDML